VLHVQRQAQDRTTQVATVKQLHSAGVLGTFDAAVASKDAAGKVKIIKTEKATRHGCPSVTLRAGC
jgi:hypothetical protein